MSVRRRVAGYRPPRDRVAQLRTENADLRAEIRRLRVTLAVARYAHPNPPLPDQAPKRRGPRLPCPRPIPDQRDPDPAEMWPLRHGIRIPPQRLRQPRREGQG